MNGAVELPGDLAYLRDPALKYGIDDLQVVEHQSLVIARLTKADLEQLARLYLNILEREDVLAINAWLQGIPAERRMVPAWRSVEMLLLLFEALAREGIKPFDSGEVKWLDLPGPALDWTKLPRELRYLAAPAEKYGKIQFDNQVEEFLRTVTPEQIAELRPVAERANGDVMALHKWMDAYNMCVHQEAARVHFFLTLMTEMGLL